MVLLFTLEWHKIPLVKYYAAQTRNSGNGDSSLLEARIYLTNSLCIKSIRRKWNPSISPSPFVAIYENDSACDKLCAWKICLKHLMKYQPLIHGCWHLQKAETTGEKRPRGRPRKWVSLFTLVVYNWTHPLQQNPIYLSIAPCCEYIGKTFILLVFYFYFPLYFTKSLLFINLIYIMIKQQMKSYMCSHGFNTDIPT